MKLFQNSSIKSILIPLFAVFASIRGYTIFVLIVAQYLSARYILAPHREWIDHLTDHRLFLLVWASSMAISGGYIINNFYDAEKDRINRPQQYLLHQILSPRTQLGYYMCFNLACLFLAAWVSIRVFFFFLAYIVGIWLYSHALKKTYWASNIFAALLAITPFFVMGLYFKNLSTWVMYHAVFLFLIILIRDLVKDLQNFKGDWVRKYNTTAVHFGIQTTKWIVSFIIGLSFIPIALLLNEDAQLRSMYYFFLCCIPYLIGILVVLWNANDQKLYLWLHNLLKILILAGVGSIILVRYPL